MTTRALPEWLFHETEIVKQINTTHPTDSFDPAAYANHEAALWKKRKSVPVKAKKTLYIADWTAEQWSDEKKILIRNLVQGLLIDGFEVLLWQGDDLQPVTLTLDNVDLLAYASELLFSHVTPVSKEGLAEKTERFPDQIELLDKIKLSQLLGENLQPPAISVEDIADSSFSASLLTEFAARSGQKIIRTTIDDSIDDSIDESWIADEGRAVTDIRLSCSSSSKEAKQVKELKLQDKITTLTLLSQEDEVYEEIVPLVRNLVVFNAENVEGVPEIESDFFDSKEVPVDITRVFPSLTVLNLRNATLLGNLDSPYSLLNPALLPRLTSLHLPKSEDRSLLQDWRGEPFSQLVHFSAYGTRLDPNALTAILTTAIGLKTLDLEMCEGLSTLQEDFLQGHVLNALHTFNALDCEFPFQAILKVAPNLENLTIGINPDRNEEQILTGCLNQLRRLELVGTKIDKKFMKEIVDATGYLRELIFLGCTVVGGSFDNLPNSILMRLRKLEIRDCRSAIDDFFNITKHIPHLEVLTIQGSPVDNDIHTDSEMSDSDSEMSDSDDELNEILCFDMPLEWSLEQLKKINLISVTFSPFKLNELLKKMPNLQVLRIEKSESATLFFLNMLDEEAVGKLKELYLDLKNSHIDSRSILRFLERTPKIKRLHIEGGERLQDCIRQIPKDQLGKFQHFYIKPLSKNDREYILTHAKSLSLKSKSLLRSEMMDSLIKRPLLPRRGNQMGKSLSIDANTENNPDKKFHFTHVFKNLSDGSYPDPKSYRASVMDSLTFRTNADTPFEFANSHDSISPCDEKVTKSLSDTKNHINNSEIQNEDKEYFYGKKIIVLTDKWQELPSLSPDEKMIAIHVKDLDPSDVRVGYSSHTNLYYIRQNEGHEPRETIVDFMLEVSGKLLGVEWNLPDGVRSIIAHCRSFGEGELIKASADLSGVELINAIWIQKKGSCRHRVAVCMHYLNSQFPHLRVRAVFNGLHAYLEIYIEESERWSRIDLGGYGRQIDIAYMPEDDFDAMQVETFEPSPFKTWIVQNTQGVNIEKYLGDIINGSHPIKESPAKNIMLEFDDAETTYLVTLLLQKGCRQSKKSYIVIDSPDKLSCKSSHVALDEQDQCQIKSGSEGALYRFLTSNYEQAPVIIIPLDEKFSMKPYGFLDNLFDNPRKADGVAIPDNTIIILLSTAGLTDNLKLSLVARADGVLKPAFNYSRLAQLSDSLINIVQTDEHRPVNSLIDLSDATDWQQALIGRFYFNEGKLIYKEGQLVKLFKLPKDNCEEKNTDNEFLLEIKNGPWHDEEFVRFWQKIKLQGYIEYYGKRLRLPDKLTLLRSEGYNWRPLVARVSWRETEKPDYLLNPTTLNRFFTDYICIDGGKLSEQAGWLQAHKEQAMSVYVTHQLSTPQWVQFLTHAHQHEIELQIALAPGLTAPDELGASKKAVVKKAMVSEIDITDSNATQVFVSDDIDYVTSKLACRIDDAWVLPISQQNCSTDLLPSLDAKLSHEAGQYIFFTKKPSLWQALSQGKKVIISGKMNKELVQALACLCQVNPYCWVNGKKEVYSGKLFIVTDNASLFSFTDCQHIAVSQQAIRQQLQSIHPKELFEKLPKKEYSFTKLNSMLVELGYNPASLPEDPWRGLESIPVQPAVNSVDLRLEASNKFKQERLKKITDGLKKRSVIFISGLTGVGKTYTIKKDLPKEVFEVFYGEDKLKEWAESKSERIKISFRDEGNLLIDHDMSDVFEGLTVQPPGMLIGGNWYELGERHKVIVAGNPGSDSRYGGRQTQEFFKRHGGAVIFEPLPPACLYHDVLKPLFTRFKVEDECAVGISKKLLMMYQYICTFTTDTILISPRELKTIVLLIAAESDLNDKNIDHYTARHAYLIVSSVIPQKYQAAFKAWFERTFNVDSRALIEHYNSQSDFSSFILTQSRKEAYAQFVDLLTLRKGELSLLCENELKESEKPGLDNEHQQSIGLGGLLLKGQAGTGKSLFLREALELYGFTEIFLENNITEPGYYFYVIKPDMSIEKQMEVLQKAFNYGHVVVIKSINSMPQSEQLLNAFTMGHDMAGNPPEFPGFKLFATQTAGTISVAIERRLLNVQFPPYTKSELYEIITRKFKLPPESANELIDDYLKCYAEAERQGYSPAPTLQNLWKEAEARKAKSFNAEQVLVGKNSKQRNVRKFEQLDTNSDAKEPPVKRRRMKTPQTASRTESSLDEDKGSFDSPIPLLSGGAGSGRAARSPSVSMADSSTPDGLSVSTDDDVPMTGIRSSGR